MNFYNSGGTSLGKINSKIKLHCASLNYEIFAVTSNFAMSNK